MAIPPLARGEVFSRAQCGAACHRDRLKLGKLGLRVLKAVPERCDPVSFFPCSFSIQEAAIFRLPIAVLLFDLHRIGTRFDHCRNLVL